MKEEDDLLTKSEQETIESLKNAWNAFVELPKLHPEEKHEFAHAIHEAQRIIFSRVILRGIKENKDDEKKD